MTDKSALPETNAYLAGGHNHPGNALAKSGPSRNAEAEDCYRDAIKICRALVVVFPGVKSNHDELQDVQKNLKFVVERRAKQK